MITIFKRFRKNFLTDGKTRKPALPVGRYLKYAIGETVLVVIGILIALHINNLNEERKEGLKSKIYCNRIINDLIADTLNINVLIKDCSAMIKEGDHYFSYFNQGQIDLEKLMDSSTKVNFDFMRYFPVNYTYLDMQSSGNSNLLNDRQKNALFELFSTQEQIQIIIEKSIVRIQNQIDLRDGILGSPNDFYTKIAFDVSDDDKAQWLLQQHLNFNISLSMYKWIEKYGNTIKEQTKNAILILKDSSEI